MKWTCSLVVAGKEGLRGRYPPREAQEEVPKVSWRCDWTNHSARSELASAAVNAIYPHGSPSSLHNPMPERGKSTEDRGPTCGCKRLPEQPDDASYVEARDRLSWQEAD